VIVLRITTPDPFSFPFSFPTPDPFVRRAKAPIFSRCNSCPATVAPAGSNRSGGGGNETAEAFDEKDRVGDSASTQAVTCSERRGGLETENKRGQRTLFLSRSEKVRCPLFSLFTWTVDPRLSVDAIDDQTNVPGDTVSLAVAATDAASETVTLVYSATGLPAGLSMDSGTGVISGTVSASISSTPSVVTVTASDGTASASQTFNWSVVPVTLANPDDQINVGGATVRR